MEIDYGRLDALEAILGGRAAIEDAYLKGKSYGAPGSVVSVDPSAGAGGVIIPAHGAGNNGAAVLRDAVSVLDFAGADRTGNSASGTALKNAFAEAAALAVSGYGASKGAAVHVPGGRWLMDQKITVPSGLTMLCDGFSETSFLIPASFPDNAVFENALGAEFMGLSRFSLFGQGDAAPSTNQPNAGSATTVATTITTPANAPGSDGGAAVFGFDLVVNGTGLGYASNGTILVGGAKRITYRSWTEAGGKTTFKNCLIVSGYGTFHGGGTQAITAGDTVTAVTTDNVSGIHAIGLGAPSYIRDAWVDIFTDNCIKLVNTNCLGLDTVWANYSNRDCILDTGSSGGPVAYRNITAQYSGQPNDGRATGGLHVLGMSGPTTNFFGRRSVKGLYSEQASQNAKGLWVEDAGSLDGDDISLVGGVNTGGTAFATQTAVQLDSNQTTPLTEDSCHSANISLRNLYSAQVGRTTLKDNVRGNSTPANTSSLGLALTRYDTEDSSPGSVGAWTALKYYFINSLVTHGGVIYQRNAAGFAAATWGADSTNWTAISAGVAFADREHTVEAGTLSAFRETYNGRQIPFASSLTLTSGTQAGGLIKLLAGESYDHVKLNFGSTPAVFGTNADGHWYAVVYDPSGNLVTQTADQGNTAIGASSVFRLALQSTITPAVDGPYKVMVMVYLGTGGSPSMPTFRGAAVGDTSVPVTGMPQPTYTANAGQTTGANAYANPAGTGLPPATLGSTGTMNQMPYFMLYK